MTARNIREILNGITKTAYICNLAGTDWAPWRWHNSVKTSTSSIQSIVKNNMKYPDRQT